MKAAFRLEIKATHGREFEGYGSVFGNRDLGGDIIVRGAFKASLERHRAEGTMPLMFWMHQPDQVPGVWKDIAEDDRGLYVRGELVDTQLGREMQTLLGKKAVRGLSIGYVPVDTDYDAHADVRYLKAVDLFEVSIVSMAMNPLARVEAMKSRLSGDGEYVPTERELEQHFRSLGCSKSVARTLTARVFNDSDAGGMPGSRRWDAGAVEDDDATEQLKRDLLRLADKFGAQALRRVSP